MAERKCSVCSEPGHTKRTCKADGVAEHADHVSMQAPDREPSGYADPDMPVPADAWGPPAPIYTGDKPGEWFPAAFPGICEIGGEGFDPGGEVRADGQGGYECRDCATFKEEHERAWERPTAANVKMPEPVGLVIQSGAHAGAVVTVLPDTDPACCEPCEGDETPMADAFTTPAPVSIVAPSERDDDPLTTTRGYLIKDPRTGDYNRYKNGSIKPFTRTSTLVKAASNQKGITDWSERNVVMGAVLRPDLVAQARGLNHEDHKDQLQSIARMLGEAAGSRSGSDAGTMFHTITEKLDAGTAHLDQVPKQYRELARKYMAALADAGFRVMPDMIERSVFLPQYGGIGGTFDRVLFHEPTGQYVMSDVKSGKSMDFGWSEIEAQEWVYAMAYNKFGTWNHTTKVWEPPKIHVATDYGLVMHTPVKGKLAGQVQLLRTDLQRGGRHAELCATVRAADSVKAKAVAWSVPDAWAAAGRPDAPTWSAAYPPSGDWDELFSSVTTVAEAGVVWQQAKEAGVEGMRLNWLVQLAQSALRTAGITG